MIMWTFDKKLFIITNKFLLSHYISYIYCEFVELRCVFMSTILAQDENKNCRKGVKTVRDDFPEQTSMIEI